MKLWEFTDKNMMIEEWRATKGYKNEFDISVYIKGNPDIGYSLHSGDIEGRKDLTIIEIKTFADAILEWYNMMQKEITLK